MRRVRVVVHGRVQGVFFRTSCAREARARGASGWIRNRPDGSVEAVFEGRTSVVEALVAWCRTGPDLASVESIEISEEPAGVDPGFAIR